jgi:DNA invertase Pin-like site-specific DNA recombinase
MMRLVGYARTRLIEQLGEADLEQQERSLAEFCDANNHELTHVVADDGENLNALNEALEADADGIVVIDPLVIAQDVSTAHDIAAELIKREKHLFMVYREKHIDPRNTAGEQDLVDSCLSLIDRKVS